MRIPTQLTTEVASSHGCLRPHWPRHHSSSNRVSCPPATPPIHQVPHLLCVRGGTDRFVFLIVFLVLFCIPRCSLSTRIVLLISSSCIYVSSPTRIPTPHGLIPTALAVHTHPIPFQFPSSLSQSPFHPIPIATRAVNVMFCTTTAPYDDTVLHVLVALHQSLQLFVHMTRPRHPGLRNFGSEFEVSRLKHH